MNHFNWWICLWFPRLLLPYIRGSECVIFCRQQCVLCSRFWQALLTGGNCTVVNWFPLMKTEISLLAPSLVRLKSPSRPWGLLLPQGLQEWTENGSKLETEIDRLFLHFLFHLLLVSRHPMGFVQKAFFTRFCCPDVLTKLWMGFMGHWHKDDNSFLSIPQLLCRNIELESYSEGRSMHKN